MTACGTWRDIVRVAAAALLLALAMAIIGCGGEPSSDVSHPSVAPSETPKAGGTLTVACQVQPWTLDPALASNTTERSVDRAVYQGLFRYDAKPGAEGTRLIPCLATEVPSRANGLVSDDGRTYTITLRPGVSFQPPLNRELTARDVKYSLERVIDVASSEAKEPYLTIAGAEQFLAGRSEEIRGLEVVDDLTLRVRLAKPDPAILSALADEPGHVVPEEWVEKWGAEFGKHPLGTGPFVFLKWVPGESVKLARNPRYWEAGKPHVDGLEYELALAPSAALTRLSSGQVDLLSYGLTTEDVATFAGDSEWKDRVASRSQLAATYLFLNTKAAPFDDVRVRRALSWAIDRQKLAELEEGRARSLWQFFPLDLPGHEKSTAFASYAPGRTKVLLRHAGYPDGIVVVLSVQRGVDDADFVRAIRGDLAAAGITTRLKTLNPAQYRRRLTEPQGISLGLVTWQATVADPDDWVRTMCARPVAGASGTNCSRWWSPKLEAERAEANSFAYSEARIAAFEDMQRTIASGAPYVPLVSWVQTSASSKQVGGFYLHPVYQLDAASYWKK